MKFWNSLFGGGAQKHEDKGDELRLDFEYRDAAFRYQQALDALEESDAAGSERLKRKLREVRRQALDQLLEESEELLEHKAPDLAHEKLEIALNFADEDAAREEVERRLDSLGTRAPAPPAPEAESPDVVTGTEGDLFELALSAMEPADQERARELGEPFREAYEACQNEEWEEALHRLTDLVESHPEDPLLLEMTGMAAENLDRNDEALAWFRRARDASPNRPATVQGMAALYRKLDRPAEAQNTLSEAAAERPPRPGLSAAWIEIHIEHALALSEAGHHEEALGALTALIGLPQADKGFLLYNLGGVLEKAGNESDAHAALEEAVEAAPRQALYRERLADFLLKRGRDLDTALRLLIGANEMETTSGGALLGGGGTRVTISPNRARYLYKIARIYFLKGEDLEAERTITTALHISKDPEVSKALQSLRAELKEVRQQNP